MVNSNSVVSTTDLQNVSIVNANDIVGSRGVGCCTPSGVPLGVWLDPSGSTVGRLRQGPFYVLPRITRIDLFRDSSFPLQEGIFTCRITDGDTTVNLYVGIYSDDNFQAGQRGIVSFKRGSELASCCSKLASCCSIARSDAD